MGWVKRDNLDIIATDIDPEFNDTTTHFNYLLGLPPEWRGQSDSNLIRWRYVRKTNSIYWWSFNRPTEEEKTTVEKWLKDNLNTISNNHRIMYVPSDTDKSGRDREIAHGW